jgi:hypothetical protein
MVGSEAFPATVVDLARFQPLEFCDKRMKRMSYFQPLMSKCYAATALSALRGAIEPPSDAKAV